jgi:hypothetical protein
MKIVDLGLTTSLRERSIPADQLLDLQMLHRIDQEIELKQEIDRRKRRLGAILRKIDKA